MLRLDEMVRFIERPFLVQAIVTWDEWFCRLCVLTTDDWIIRNDALKASADALGL